MDLSDRLAHVKCSTKDEDIPTYTPDDILFLFGDIIHLEGLILNHSNPSECFVLFPLTVPLQDTIQFK